MRFATMMMCGVMMMMMMMCDDDDDVIYEEKQRVIFDYNNIYMIFMTYVKESDSPGSHPQ